MQWHRTLSGLLLYLCAALNLQAAEPGGARTPPQPVSPATPEADRESEPRPASPPVRNFTPSEKIGADSAVSFPVDI